MAQLKELPNILGADVSNEDLIILDDRSEDTTKKITIAELGDVFVDVAQLALKADRSYVQNNFATITSLSEKQGKTVKVIKASSSFTITEEDWGALVINENAESVTVTLPTIAEGFQIFFYSIGGPIVINPETSSIGSGLVVNVGSISSAWFSVDEWIIASLSSESTNVIKPHYTADINLNRANVLVLQANGNVAPFVPIIATAGDPRPPIVGITTKSYDLGDSKVEVYKDGIILTNVLTGLGFVSGDTVIINEVGNFSNIKPPNNYQYLEVGHALNENDLIVDFLYRGTA